MAQRKKATTDKSAASKTTPRRKKYHLVLFQGWHEDATHKSIRYPLFHEVQGRLDDAITTGPDETDLYVWLHSPGGDAHATFKLAVDLRRRSNYVRVIIPDYAKSAATLLTLGMDEIYMGPSAELGPLDTQIKHPDRDEGISALDLVDALEWLEQNATDLSLASGASIIRYTGLSRNEVLSATLRFTADFLRPVVEKIDPYLLHQAWNLLRMTEIYAQRLIGMRNVPDKFRLSQEQAEMIATSLVNKYPEHGFMIGRNEAQRMGLPVLHAEQHEHWSKVKALHRNLLQFGKTIIEVYPEEALKQSATKAKAVTKRKSATKKKKNDGTQQEAGEAGRAAEAE